VSTGRILVLEPDLLSPDDDSDLAHQTDHDHPRFDERIDSDGSQPHRWYRYALNVNQKNGWLGTGGVARAESTLEWRDSFHGTKKNSSAELLQGRMSKREVYGRGIYCSPSIEVAELYAEEFLHQSKKYKVVFQNRVNSDGLIKEVIPADCHHDRKRSDSYWILLQTREEYVQPYGICVKKC
jgi:hypothetical protein